MRHHGFILCSCAIFQAAQEGGYTMRNELGFAVCRRPDGSLTHGPPASGTPTSVNIPVSCPPETAFAALFHTHPGGVAYPSSIDVASALRVAAPNLCITVPETGQTRCFRVKRRA